MPWEQRGSGYTTKDRGGFVRNPGQYEKLRSKGMSKKRAAMIVNKSLVNGKFVPISQLDAAGRAALRGGGAYKQAKHAKDPDIEAYRKLTSDPQVKAFKNAMFAENPTPAQKKMLQQVADESGAMAYTMRRGGKNTGQSKVYENTAFFDKLGGKDAEHARRTFEHTVAHEKVHAAPKRSEYRFWQASNTPYKSGKEEARADYMASGHHKSGNWRKPLSGYPLMASMDRISTKIATALAPGQKQEPAFGAGYAENMRNLKDKGAPFQHQHYSEASNKSWEKRRKVKQVAGGTAAVAGAGAGGTAYVKHNKEKWKRDLSGRFSKTAPGELGMTRTNQDEERIVKDSIELEKSDSLWRRDIAKAGWNDRSKGNRNTALGTAIGGAGLGSGIGAATAAKKGKKLKTGALAGGRSLAEGIGGGTVGSAVGSGIGALASRGRGSGAQLGASVGSSAGGLAGGFHGGNASVNNSRRKGYLKRNY